MKRKLLTVAIAVALLSGCAGMSEQQVAEKQALKELHKAEAKVDRKNIKLALATAATVAASDNVAKSLKELKEAKREKTVAQENLNKILGVK